MDSLEQLKQRIETRFPGAEVAIVPNDSPSKQTSLLIPDNHASAIAQYLRSEPDLQFDYLSNVTGVDWPDLVTREKVKVTKMVDGVEKQVEETVETKRPGFLEVVYHLYSMSLKHGPVVLRMRTQDRSSAAQVPSLTPIWRGAEFQEREVFDLYGVHFSGHPDLRRLLMWEGFQDHPMRKDYTEPDDYEYEPTPHEDVLDKAKVHYPVAVVVVEGAK